MDIRSDRQKSLSYTELGKKYYMDPRTAKRYAESPERPEYTLSELKPTKMDPFKPVVDEWLKCTPSQGQHEFLLSIKRGRKSYLLVLGGGTLRVYSPVMRYR